MFFGTDDLANFFMFVFLFGLIFTVASLLLGFAHAGSLHGGHSASHNIDLNLGGHHAHIGVGGHDGPGFFNTPTIMAFLTWFGGSGYIFRQSLGFIGVLALPMALVSGLVGGAIMSSLLTRVLWPMMSPPLESEDFTLPGTRGRVVSSIREGGVGEVVYSKGDARFVTGARGLGGQPIPKGASVVIVQYEKGLALVQDLDAVPSGDTIAIGEAKARVGR